MIDRTIFKANDIRGIVAGPTPPGAAPVAAEWDTDGAHRIGAALVEALRGEGALPARGSRPAGSLVVGRDMRVSGPEMSRAFVDGVRSEGVDVIDIGLASTDGLWFASGRLELPGAMFTASHNPAAYNGIKFCLSGARPVSSALLVEIADRATAEPDAGSASAVPVEPGRLIERDLLPEYAAHLHALVDLSGLRRLRVVADAGNGMAGHTLPAVLGGPLADRIELFGLFTELDGTFPNHQPNPLEPQNLVDAQAAVREHGADLALVFDGDADRCFIIDERGEVVSPSTVTAMIAAQELAREPGATIVKNKITSRSVAEVVEENGGVCVTTRVGHTFVKAAMAEHDAIFGGEHSAHYYFRDFWGADTGMLAGLHVLALVGRSDRPLSELAAGYARYVGSGEINSTVADARAVMDEVAAAFEGRGVIDFEDGLTVNGDDWWINLRPSNTEPLLRLNVESVTQSVTDRLRDEVLALVRR